MALAEMSLAADWTYFGYLKSISGYQSEFEKNKDSIEAGIKIYNDEKAEAERDSAAEKAFLQERQGAEAFLGQSPKDYAGMSQRVGTWKKLLPAINGFAAAQRDFIGREPSDNDEAETKAKLEFANITVPYPSPQDAFVAGKDKIVKLGGSLDNSLRDRATQKLSQIPDLYKKTPVIVQLISDTKSTEQQKEAKASKQLLAWSEALAGSADAKKLLDDFAGGKNLHPAATAVLTPFAPSLPGPMTSAKDEQDRIAQAMRLQEMLPDGQAYTDARKQAGDAWAKSKPTAAEKAYTDATASFKTVEEMRAKTVLLQAVAAKINDAVVYSAAVDQLGKDLAKIERLEPEASSPEGKKFALDLKQARDGGASLASGGRFVEAKQAIDGAQLLVQKRSREIKDARGQVAGQAKAGFDPKNPQIGTEAMAVLSKLHATVPKPGNDALLEGGHPHLKLAELDAPARKYTRLLEQAKSNWTQIAPTPLNPTYAAATKLTVPTKADEITAGFFDKPMESLTAFNKLWQDAKDFSAQDKLVQESFEVLEELYRTGKQAGNAREYLSQVSDARKQLSKLRTQTSARNYDLGGLATLGNNIDELLKQFAGAARENAHKLVANDPTSKKLIDAIDKVSDKSGNDAVAALYMAFGTKLPALLRGLSTGVGDDDQTKAVAALKTLVEKLGAKGLRRLSVSTSGDDAAATGKLLTDVRDKGLAGAGPDQNQSLDRLVTAFPDQADLGSLLNRLAAGDAAEAGPRLAEVLSTYLGQDIAKLKAPFYENLKKLSVGALPRMLTQAKLFESKAATHDELEIDPATIKNLDCPPERIKHILNRHTYEYCEFSGENFQNAATFWPSKTSADDIQSYLAAAIKAIDPVPDPQTMPSFDQYDVSIDAGGTTVEVRVGFEKKWDSEEGDYKVRITQFYPKGGNGLTQLSTLQMKFIGRGLLGK